MMVAQNQNGYFEVELWIGDRWYKALLRTFDEPNYAVDPLGGLRYERWMLDILASRFSPRVVDLVLDAIDMWLVEQGGKTRMRIISPALRKRIEEVQARLQEQFQSLTGRLQTSIDRSAMEIRLLGGRTVLLRSATHPDRLRGLNLDWVWIDEACFVSEDVFKVAIGRLRQSPNRWWLTTSPLRPSWVYDMFIAETAPLAGSVNVIHAKTDENPFISADYAEFLRRAYVGAWAERELDALWVDVRGQVFQHEWIQYSDELSREHLVHRVMGVDLAVGMGEQHDFTAMVVVAHEPRYNKFQVDAAVRGKWTFAFVAYL